MIVPPVNPYATALAGTAQAQQKVQSERAAQKTETPRPALPTDPKQGLRPRDARDRDPKVRVRLPLTYTHPDEPEPDQQRLADLHAEGLRALAELIILQHGANASQFADTVAAEFARQGSEDDAQNWREVAGLIKDAQTNA